MVCGGLKFTQLEHVAVTLRRLPGWELIRELRYMEPALGDIDTDSLAQVRKPVGTQVSR